MDWKFERTESGKKTLEEGRYRVAIESAEKAKSKSGNDMLVLTLKVSGGGKLWDYITFLPDRPEITNRKLTQLFDCFGIEDGNFNLSTYVGKVGGVEVKIEDDKPRVKYYLYPKETEKLPPWVGDIPAPVDNNDDDDDLPF